MIKLIAWMYNSFIYLLVDWLILTSESHSPATNAAFHPARAVHTPWLQPLCAAVCATWPATLTVNESASLRRHAGLLVSSNDRTTALKRRRFDPRTRTYFSPTAKLPFRETRVSRPCFHLPQNCPPLISRNPTTPNFYICLKSSRTVLEDFWIPITERKCTVQLSVWLKKKNKVDAKVFCAYLVRQQTHAVACTRISWMWAWFW